MTWDKAAAFLQNLSVLARRSDGLPPDLAPKSRSDGYKIQAFTEKYALRPLFGWKIAATSVAGQKHIGVDGPLAGRYVGERVVPSGSSIPFGNNGMKVAEVEFAFKLGRDLPPRPAPYTEAEVMAAVASAHPAIEIPDSRFEHFERVGAPALIADNACALWLCVGDAMPDEWRELDLAAFEPTGIIKGKPPVKGKGSNVLGSPVIAMAWIANELSREGIGLKAGHTVTTGTCLVPMAIAPGDHVTGDFGSLGKVTLQLGA